MGNWPIPKGQVKVGMLYAKFTILGWGKVPLFFLVRISLEIYCICIFEGLLGYIIGTKNYNLVAFNCLSAKRYYYLVE